MTRKLQTVVIILILFSALAPLAAFAQEEPPLQLQVDARVRVNGNRPVGANFGRRIEPGNATVRGRVLNLEGGETALVTLRFDYPSDAPIALDEIVSRIVISIEDADGGEFSTVAIDPNNINLNPNRVPLTYSATLYIPENARRNGYVARVQVFGNYE
jgi:hypothetical protein